MVFWEWRLRELSERNLIEFHCEFIFNFSDLRNLLFGSKEAGILVGFSVKSSGHGEMVRWNSVNTEIHSVFFMCYC